MHAKDEAQLFHGGERLVDGFDGLSHPRSWWWGRLDSTSRTQPEAAKASTWERPMPGRSLKASKGVKSRQAGSAKAASTMAAR
jgi:hypothetical protein